MKERYEDDEEDDYRKRAAIERKEKLSKGIFKLPEGETTFRLLETPPDKERKSRKGWMENYVHWNVGPKMRVLTCGLRPPADTGSCWLCGKLEREREKGNSKLFALCDKKRQLVVQVAVWDDDIGGLRGPLLWGVGKGKTVKSLDSKLLSILSNEKGYLDPKTGYNFTLERTGMGFKDTTYGAPVRADEPSRVPKAILTKLKPFVDVIQPYDPEEQKRAFFGTPDEDEGQQEEQPSRPKRKYRLEDDEEEQRVAKPKKFDEDDEDEVKPKKKVVDEEDEDLEYGEDEPKPKKKKVVEEDEDEDEPPVKKKKKPVEDEEDEDEAPPKKKKRVIEEEEDDDDPPPTPKKKKVVDDDDDEDEDEINPVDEDEDEPPVKKKKRLVEEEEEEDEPPVKKKKRVIVEDDDE